MTTIKEKLRRGINPPNMLQSMASGYRRAALEEIERLEKVIDELRAENARLALIVADHEMADYKSQVEELKAKLAALQTQEVAAKYIGTCADGDMIQTYVDVKNGTDLFLAAGAAPGQPTAASTPLKYNPAPVYTSNCIRHPAAPHGVDVDASWRAGKTVCVCASWAPGEAS